MGLESTDMGDYSDFNAMEMQRARANALRRKREKVRDPNSIDFSEPDGQELGPANSGESTVPKARPRTPSEELERRRLTLLYAERR